jgi:hypothetical protein
MPATTDRTRWLALLVLCAGMLMIVLDDAGLASGLVNTTVQVGGALGLAVLATLAATRSGGLLAHGDPVAAALTGGSRLAFLIGAGLIVVALAVAVTVLQPERRAAREPAPEPAAAETSWSEAA